MNYDTKIYKIILILFLLVIIIYLYTSIKIENFENFDDVKIKKHHYEDYEILEISNILTSQECKQLIEYTRNKGLEDSNILSYGTAKTDVLDTNYRRSKQAWISDAESKITMKLAKFSELITGLPMENQELTQVAYYEPNGTFLEHYDSCVHEKAFCDKINNYSGERRATLLVYLNTDYTDGETEFVELGLKIKPEVGKGILFWSTDENEKLLLKSKHKANIVTSGQKWIATKWSHARKYV